MIGRTFLGRYEIIRLLGEGGMGQVFLARQLDLGRQVVVKVMHDHIAADEKFRGRFEREFKLMARFQHPYVVSLYDASLDDPSGPCIVMEYVRGIALDRLLAKNQRLSAARVGRLVGQLCEVLQAAHDEGLIHRDLKPANLMVVDPDTPREKIKVMDFGLAKDLDSNFAKKLTDTNVEFVGTPGYICPELVRGEEIDHRADLYGVGVIMYELLTGRLPFNGPTSMDIFLAHATEMPPTFSELGLDGVVPLAIEELVFASLAKEADQRPPTARDLAERFETALAHEQAMAEMGAEPPPSTVIPAPTHQAAAQPVPFVHDPNALSFQMEAWMPEKIAIVKLRGFVHDAGGEVVESVPGLIRVRLGGGRSGKTPTSSALSWLGFGRRSGPLDVELRLYQVDPQRENLLLVQVLFRPSHPSLLNDPGWKERCKAVYIEIRSYLMGRSDCQLPN